MTFLTIPDLAIILWMSVVLVRLRRKDTGHFLNVWSVALGLIVSEGIARIVYLNTPRTMPIHDIAHATALDAYLLAGIGFLLSSLSRKRSIARDTVYFGLCAAPHIVLLTAYGLESKSRSLFLGAAVAAIITTAIAAAILKRPIADVLYHAIVCVPLIVLVWNGLIREAVYFLLFAIYASTALGFFLTLPRNRWGRRVVTTGFAVWSLCFLAHPWLAQSHPLFNPVAERIWDLQKFVVTFGLLILALEETSAANEYDALHDILTGLPNRRLLSDRIEQDIARARRNGTRVLLFNIDLDGFKKINDNWGHEAGDFVLGEAARRLRSITREPDTLSRVGGDEFYLVVNDFHIPGESEAPLSAVLERSLSLVNNLRTGVESQPFILERNGAKIHLSVGLSIGCAIFPEQGSTSEELYRIADRAMYEDKRSHIAERQRIAASKLAVVPRPVDDAHKASTMTDRIN
jgi:diguanylate cyclase (GGDEF)-like protein